MANTQYEKKRDESINRQATSGSFPHFSPVNNFSGKQHAMQSLFQLPPRENESSKSRRANAEKTGSF